MSDVDGGATREAQRVKHHVLDRDEAREIMAEADPGPDVEVDANALLDELEGE